MELIGPLVITSLVQGALYGLVGLAFLAIYNASRLLNFSQGEFLMLGGIGCWLAVSVWKLPPPLAFVIVVGGVAVVGVAIQWLATPLINRNTPMFTIAILTMGCSQVIAGVVGPATSFQFEHVRGFFGSSLLTVGDQVLLPEQALIVVATVALAAGYGLFLRLTWLGRGLRAIGVDREMAGLVGIRSSVMSVVAFIVSAAIAGTSGFLVAPIIEPQAQMGILFLVKGFAAAVIGGLGNPFAALLGGLFLAVSEAFLAAYVNQAFSTFGVFVIMIAVILIRPAGLFSQRDAEIL